MYCFDDGGGDSDCGGSSGAVGYQTIMMSWIASGHTNHVFPELDENQTSESMVSSQFSRNPQTLADWNPEFVK
jgi:hypothetical protein